MDDNDDGSTWFERIAQEMEEREARWLQRKRLREEIGIDALSSNESCLDKFALERIKRYIDTLAYAETVEEHVRYLRHLAEQFNSEADRLYAKNPSSFFESYDLH